MAMRRLEKLSGKIVEPVTARLVKTELMALAEESADYIVGGLIGNATMYRRGEGWWIFIPEGEPYDPSDMVHTEHN